jgi:hypothetical protein
MPPAASDNKALRLNMALPLDYFAIDFPKQPRYPAVPTAAAILPAAQPLPSGEDGSSRSCTCGCRRRDVAIADATRQCRTKSYGGAPRQMKMGNIASP